MVMMANESADIEFWSEIGGTVVGKSHKYQPKYEEWRVRFFFSCWQGMIRGSEMIKSLFLLSVCRASSWYFEGVLEFCERDLPENLQSCQRWLLKVGRWNIEYVILCVVCFWENSGLPSCMLEQMSAILSWSYSTLMLRQILWQYTVEGKNLKVEKIISSLYPEIWLLIRNVLMVTKQENLGLLEQK